MLTCLAALGVPEISFQCPEEKVSQSQGYWGEEGRQVFRMSQRGTIRRFLLSRDAYRDLGVQNSQSQKPGLLYLCSGSSMKVQVLA